MHIKNSIIVMAMLCLSSFGSAATLCVPGKESGTYSAVNRQSDCAWQEPVVIHAPEIAAINGQDTISEVHVPVVEAVSSLSPSTPPVDHPTWDLRAEDGSVYAAIRRWSSTAGWQVSWEIPVDFPVEILDSSTGTFENSVRRVLTAFHVSDYPPYPCFHENKVVRVVRRIQGNDDECKQ